MANFLRLIVNSDILGEKVLVTHIHYLLIPRFNMFSLVNVMEPIRVANYLSDQILYTHSFISFDGSQIVASNGMSVACVEANEKLGRNDFVVILGSWGAEHYTNSALFSWLRLQARNGTKLCAVEMGAYLLARSGLLAKRKATTHWAYLPGFQEQFPEIEANEQLYTEEGRILCCSGSTAGLDVMLHLVKQDHGATLAAEVSDIMLHHAIREGTDPQRKTLGRGTEKLIPDVQKAVALIEKNISEPLAVPEIAQDIGISQRQLERQFKKSVGCSIVQFGLLLRLQHARVLLISTDLGVREIATASGFNSLSHFAFAFKKCFGRRPSEYREAWPKQDNAPHWPGTLGRFLDTLKPKKLVN
jgi:transcriptional regulator GlxA family with amidase domain